MICENLQFLRKEFHFSQEEVAERIGVSRQAVAKWESGDTMPDIINCIALAKLYNVSLDDLINYRREEHGGMGIPPRGKHLFGLVTVGDKGQIVIPAKARKLFDIGLGDNLLVLGDEGRGLALMKQEDILNLIATAQKEGEC